MRVSKTKYGPEGTLVFDRYMADQSICIRVMGREGPLYTATTCINVPPAFNCVWIKNWSENEGVLVAFVEAGIGYPTGRTKGTGYAIAHELELSDKAIMESMPVLLRRQV